MGLIKELKRYDNLLDLLGDESVPAEEIAFAIDEAGKSVLESVDDFAYFLRDLAGSAKVIREEEKRLAARRKTIENLESRLREVAALYMRKVEKDKLKGVLNTISLRRSEAVEIDDEAALPAAYVEVKITPRKAEIKKAINEGDDVPGAHLETRESLQIR